MPNLPINDFSRGITDYVVDGDPSSAQKLDNVLLRPDGKPYQRPGLEIYNSSAPQIPPGNQKIDDLYYFDSTLFVKSGTKLYFIQDGETSWTTLGGPNADAFADSELGAKCSWSEWRGHLFITPGPSTNKKGGCRTVKVYRNQSNTWVLYQAGLPRATAGTEDVTGESIPTSGDPAYSYIYYRVFGLKYLAKVNGVDTLFEEYGGGALIDKAVTSSDSGGGATFGSLTYTNGTYENYYTDQMRVFLYRTKADETTPYLAGVKALGVALGSDVSSNDEYDSGKCKIGEPTFTTGTPGFVNLSNHGLRTGDRVSFLCLGTAPTGLTAASSAAAQTTVYYVIYNANGSFKLATSFDNAVAGTAIALSGAPAGTNILYLHGGPLYPGVAEGNGNDPPPPCYFSTIADNHGWFAAGVDLDSTHMRASRVFQSKPNQIVAVPAGNYVDVEGGTKLAALSYAGKNPVALLRNKAYRIEGRYDALGNGQLRAVLISEVYGAVSQHVARTKDGFFFESEKGWCYTDGFKVTLLSKHLKATYAALVNKDRMSAAFDSQNGHAYFAVESTVLSSDTSKNNALFILDSEKIQGEWGVFTTASADGILQPNSLHYDSANERLLIGDQRGYVFKLDPTKYYDPSVNTATAYSTWAKKAVVWDIITTALSFGTTSLEKWVTKLHLVAKNLTGNFSADVYSYNDQKTTSQQLQAIRERTTTAKGLHRVWRWFRRLGLRCTYKQVQLKKGFVVVANSDTYGTATCNSSLRTVLLGSNWPDDGSQDLRGHLIYFNNDSYAYGWTISADSGNTLTCSAGAGTFPNTAGVKWVVKGYPKEEPFELQALDIEYDVLGDVTPGFKATSEGSNA